MAYELEALQTGWRLGLHDSDWYNLVGLAHRYGWQPEAGLDHYLRGDGWLVPPHDTQAFAEALEKALQDLAPDRRKEPRFYMDAIGGLVDVAPRIGPNADHKGYFSWQRRWIVEEVLRLCQRGALEIRSM